MASITGFVGTTVAAAAAAGGWDSPVAGVDVDDGGVAGALLGAGVTAAVVGGVAVGAGVAVDDGAVAAGLRDGAKYVVVAPLGEA
jgi:hypothetical protein